MNTKYLKDVAEIIAGYTFRTALKPLENGLMKVVQSKNISDRFYIDNSCLTKINLQEYKTKAIIEKNDIIVTSRGSFRVGVTNGDIENTIASSSVYIIRIKDNNISSEYLAVYLNSICGQRKIKKRMTGSIIKTILRKDLENIKIPIPNQDIQNKIINLYKNNLLQQKLLTKKKMLVNEINEGLIINFLKNI